MIQPRRWGKTDALLIQLPSPGHIARAASLAGSRHLRPFVSGISARIVRVESATLLTVRQMTSRTLELSDGIKECCPSLVGLSPTSTTAPRALEFSSLIKRSHPSAAVVWGGHLASGMGPQLFELTKDVDAIVLGEADRLVGQLCKSVKAGMMLKNPNVLRNRNSSLKPAGSGDPP